MQYNLEKCSSSFIKKRKKSLIILYIVFIILQQATGQGLQQGAPVNGHEAPDKPKDEDVHISDFKLTSKEKMAKETFARRYRNFCQILTFRNLFDILQFSLRLLWLVIA